MQSGRITVFSRHYAEYCYRYATALAEICPVQLVLDVNNVREQFNCESLPGSKQLQIRLFNLKLKGSGLLNTFRAWRAVKRYRPDLVHFQEIPDVLHPIVMRMVSASSRTALTVHDPNPHTGSDSRLGAPVFRLQRWARERADLLIVHGRRCYEDLCATIPHRRADIVESTHGVLMEPPAELLSETKKEATLVLCFGRMEEYKGVGVLTEAAEILTRRGVDYRLVVAGRGPELDKYQDALATNPNVEVMNRWITAEEADALYLRAGTVVMPYLNATQSGVAAAAVGNRCAIVASRIGGLPDVIEDGRNGMLVEPGNATALADALQMIVGQPDIGERMRRGADAVAKHELNWSHIVQQLAPKLLGVT